MIVEASVIEIHMMFLEIIVSIRKNRRNFL